MGAAQGGLEHVEHAATQLADPDAADVDESGGELTDPLGRFLISCSSPPSTALLPTPTADPGKGTEPAGRISKRNNGWLAAKPTAGWSTMDKVQLVLLKKSGIIAGDAPTPEAVPAALDKYRAMFKQPLPGNFIAAVESMLEATGQGKKGGGDDRGQMQAIPA